MKIYIKELVSSIDSTWTQSCAQLMKLRKESLDKNSIFFQALILQLHELRT